MAAVKSLPSKICAWKIKDNIFRQRLDVKGKLEDAVCAHQDWLEAIEVVNQLKYERMKVPNKVNRVMKVSHDTLKESLVDRVHDALAKFLRQTRAVGHDVSRRGLLRQASAGKTGSHPVCHERDNGSVVAPVRPDESNPASSSRAVPTSRGNHDEADERTERARLALVRARWEAQGGGGPTRRESTSTRQVAPTRPSTTEP